MSIRPSTGSIFANQWWCVSCRFGCHYELRSGLIVWAQCLVAYGQATSQAIHISCRLGHIGHTLTQQSSLQSVRSCHHRRRSPCIHECRGWDCHCSCLSGSELQARYNGLIEPPVIRFSSSPVIHPALTGGYNPQRHVATGSTVRSVVHGSLRHGVSSGSLPGSVLSNCQIPSPVVHHRGGTRGIWSHGLCPFGS